MICIAAGAKMLTLAATAFSLSWTHSVEKTRWEERWVTGPQGLTVVEGRVEGSGAGMEPPPDAVLRDGAYVYTPHLAPIPELVLAASGATGSGWTLCPLDRAMDAPDTRACLTLGKTAAAAVRISVCSAADDEGAVTHR